MQRMLISVDRDESRAALVNDGRLTHLEIEPINHDSVKGNIYRGVVARVEPSLQSAFVDFGRDKQGFLPVGEIHKRLKKEGQDKRTPIQDILRAGQQILVQVVRDEIGNKGATLSTYVSLPGRYLVLMPQSDKSGVSRKLSDSARARVKELTEAMNVPEGIGLIVRTSGETATKLALTRDLVYLNRLWKHIEKEFESGKGACPMYIERSMPVRFVRDYFTKDVDEIVIDDEVTVNEIGAYLKLLMPRTLRAVERYSGAMPLFARYGILGQVEAVFSRQVPLPGGGSIVIDQTEALVAIDVNSGRVKGKDIEETARQTNNEAAREVARQLVLRDLGGLVVVDFIDMRERKYVKEVEATLKSEMKKDKARHKIGRISEFGLMELSRQRLKSAVHRSAFESCKYCSGTGQYRTIESLASSIIRRIYEMITQRPVRHVIAMLPPEAANFLLNNRRRELVAVETEYGIGIEIVPVEGMTAAQVTLEHFEDVPRRGGMELLHENRLRRVTQHLDLVRNRVLKREDHDIERKIKKSKAAAMVDWGAVYKDVEEQTASVEDTPIAPKKKRRRNNRPGDRDKQAKGNEQAKAETEAPAPVAAAPAPTPAAEDYPPLPQKTGFAGWLKGIFGLGSQPAAAPTPAPAKVAEPAKLPAPEPAASAAPAEETQETSSDEEPRRRRRRRRRGGRDRDHDGDRDKSGEERTARGEGRTGGDRYRKDRDRKDGDESKARGDNADRPDTEGSDAADGEGEGKKRRRRRRRRRGGRDRDEQAARDGQDGQENAPGDGAQADGGEPGDKEAAPKRTRSRKKADDAKAADDKQAAAAEADKEDASDAKQEAGAGTPPPMPGADAGTPPPMPGAEAVADAKPEAPKMADVTSLARAEIERLKQAIGGEATTEEAADDSEAAADPAPEAAAADAETAAAPEAAAAAATDSAPEAEAEPAAEAGAEAAADAEAEAEAAADASGEAADSNGEVEAAAEDAEDAVAAEADDANGAEEAAEVAAAGDAEEETVAPPLPVSNPYVIDLRGNSGS